MLLAALGREPANGAEGRPSYVSNSGNTWGVTASSKPRVVAMPRGRQLAPLALVDVDYAQLQGVANSITVPHPLVLRAPMILADGEGLTKAAGAIRGFGEVGRKVTQALSRRGTPRLHDKSCLDRAEEL